MKSSLEELQQQHARPVFILEPEPKQEENVATFIKAIEGRPWCTAVTAEHGEIRVRASDISKAGLELLSLASESGTRLAAFRRDRPSLEDIFLHLVGEEDSVPPEAKA